MDETDILIAITLSPKNPEKQPAAVASWKALGFRVLSANPAQEIAEISQLAPDLEFYEIPAPEPTPAGRGLVPLDKVFEPLLKEGGEICGIVNSDVHLRAPAGFVSDLAQLVRGGLVFGSRQEVADINDEEGKPFTQGYDFFFFEQESIPHFTLSPLRIGAPWWDYWLPFRALTQKMPAQQLMTPVAYHQIHETNWLWDEWMTYAGFMADFIMHNAEDFFSAPEAQAGPDPFHWQAFCRSFTMEHFQKYDVLSKHGGRFGGELQGDTSTHRKYFHYTLSMAINRFIADEAAKIFLPAEKD